MHINIATGLIQGVRYVPSPNCNERLPNTTINLVVIHNISLPPGEFANNNITAFFSNTLDFSLHPYFETIRHLQVSSHFSINRQGEITQYVPVTKRAWHAGASVFKGQENCNDYSIGVELEGVDDLPYTEVQYKELVSLITLLKTAYPGITDDRIVGHDTIAPGRKTDPGIAFDWLTLSNLLQARENKRETKT